MNEQDIIRRWPGKSAPYSGGISHPAVYHMLDVAAVAELLIGPQELEPRLRDAMILLVGLHDLGKIGAPFRDMLERGQPQSAGTHWEVTEAYLHLLDHHILGPRLGGRDTRRKALYAAVAGHHGRPPYKDFDAFDRMTSQATPQGCEDAKAIVRAFLDIWDRASIASITTMPEAQCLSWRLAGLTTAADWIASNVAWFPPTAPGPSIDQHLAGARERAVRAITEAGLDTPAIRPEPLFDFALRPMQAACAGIRLPDGPALAILEDETGSGKTEAGLILAHRLLAAGKGRGLYIALPTMATADSMFARVAQILRKLYQGAPSLALAHGRAAHSELFRDLKDAHAHNPDEPGPREWLSDHRRRALLADVGVGTVDQALLAVVKARHAPLRQFGLSSKILIVDEVHELGDPYMGELMQMLLKVHASLGGSAILLSATIPLDLRARLIAAFDKGAGRSSIAGRDPAYPALTMNSAQSPRIAPRQSVRGPVAVHRADTPEAVIEYLAQAASEGAACVWVRNAVDEAIAATETLRARGVTTDLLHARFALCDRKTHEAHVLCQFGKARIDRPGRVLVATQVVENSLDLDFDVMASDLAPMAALIQRAGRLWRHMDQRPVATRPVPLPVLHVLSPSPDDVISDRWLEATLGRGAFVYPQPLQWRTARTLFKTGAIDAPQGLRALIEAAHGETLDLPEALQTAGLTHDAKTGAARAHARHNLIDWDKGYREGASGAPDAEYPTRLGEPARALVLARRDGGRLVPWSGGAWSVETCQLSEVQASASRLHGLLPDQNAPEIDAIRAGLPDWLRTSRTIIPVDHKGRGTDGLWYHANNGLQFTTEST